MIFDSNFVPVNQPLPDPSKWCPDCQPAPNGMWHANLDPADYEEKIFPADHYPTIVRHLRVYGPDSFHFIFLGGPHRHTLDSQRPNQTWNDYVAEAWEQVRRIKWGHLIKTLRRGHEAVYSGLFGKVINSYLDHYVPGLIDFMITHRFEPDVRPIIDRMQAMHHEMRMISERFVLERSIEKKEATVKRHMEGMSANAAAMFEDMEDGVEIDLRELYLERHYGNERLGELVAEMEVEKMKYRRLREVPLGRYVGLW